MISALLICAVAVSIVGGVSVPIARIIFSTYSQERKRLESGGEPKFPQTYIGSDVLTELELPKYSPERQREVNRN